MRGTRVVDPGWRQSLARDLRAERGPHRRQPRPYPARDGAQASKL